MLNLLLFPKSGGTQLTISGYGFPCDSGDIADEESQVFVTVGTKSCRVLSMCYDEIICKIAMESVRIQAWVDRRS